jgi:glyoxylase-like metal-dependent hydrolase (beta-lactamase superfamily II)
MRIDPHVYLVGSGQLGFDLTDPFDCNIYLFDAGESLVLFDAGTGMGIDQVLEVCREDQLNLAKINHLFLTHAHTDHGGGAAHLRERLDLAVYSSASTARIVTIGNEEAVSLPPAKAAGTYPGDYIYRPCPINQVLEAGQVKKIGSLTVEIIATPGHSHDHHCYLVTDTRLGKRYLVGGDAIFFGGRVVWQNTYDCSVPDTLASIQHLATYDFEALLPGHLNFSLRNGKRHVEAACSVIKTMACPMSIV